jgi:G3E family GTPase
VISSAASALNPIPVHIVTGFLGAGKTTLLNRLLRDPALADALVIVNEWGEIGLDHLLVERAEGDVLLLASGCLCCSLRGDLVEALERLLARRDSGLIKPFSRIVIETTGLADPAPILHALAADPALAGRLALASIVTLADAVNGEETLSARAEARRQVAVADWLLISKSDLAAGAERVSAVRQKLRALNPRAPLREGAGQFSIEEFLIVARRDLSAEADNLQPTPSGRFRAEEAPHSPAIRTHLLRWPTPIAWRDAAQFVDLIAGQFGARLLRVKGLIALADDPGKPLLIQGAQHVFHPPRRLPAWPDADRATRIIFIGEGIEPSDIDRLWAAFAGAPSVDQPDRAALVDNPLSPRRAGLLG